MPENSVSVLFETDDAVLIRSGDSALAAIRWDRLVISEELVVEFLQLKFPGSWETDSYDIDGWNVRVYRLAEPRLTDTLGG